MEIEFWVRKGFPSAGVGKFRGSIRSESRFQHNCFVVSGTSLREGPIVQLDAQVWSQAEGPGQEKGTWESLTWGGHLTLRRMRFMSSVAGRGR